MAKSTRLHVKGTILGYRRGRRNTYHHTALIRIDDVNDKKSSDFYLGKRIAYIYKGETKDKSGSRLRVSWGKVTRAHGSNGVVRAKFRNNLTASTMGSEVRVMLYPSRV